MARVRLLPRLACALLASTLTTLTVAGAGPAGAQEQTTLDVLHRRSDLVEEMLPLMFPGADIRAIVEGYFGKQVLFFPMSAVSLFEHELGVKDLERRTMAPFGVTEPILWLLHMHGYQVFANQG